MLASQAVTGSFIHRQHFFDALATDRCCLDFLPIPSPTAHAPAANLDIDQLPGVRTR